MPANKPAALLMSTPPNSEPSPLTDSRDCPDTHYASRQQALSSVKRVVLKIGSRLLSESPAARPAILADDIVRLQDQRGIEFLVVSSGAVALGNRVLGHQRRPTDMPALQAAAAIGQGKLLQHWEHAFAAHGRIIAQLLLTHDDIADRKRFLNARHTLHALLRTGAIPIINENDSIATEEIKYGDNDLLAALMCNLFAADLLILLTDVNGLNGADGDRIAIVRDIEREAVPVAGGSAPDSPGSGGMASKVQSAKAAAKRGALTVVAPGRRPHVLSEILNGRDIGTLFAPRHPNIQLSSRKHWIAYAAKPLGRLTVDIGAYRALIERGRSLLPAGIVAVDGEFELGDVIAIDNDQGREFARGLAGYRADDVRRILGLQSADIEATLGYKYLDAVIHRDDLVLL